MSGQPRLCLKKKQVCVNVAETDTGKMKEKGTDGYDFTEAETG